MAACTKIRFANEREALDDLRRLRRSSHGRDIRTLQAYYCPECGGFHLGHAYKTSRAIASLTRVTNAEWRHLKNRAADLGRQIAKDDARAARRKVAELAPVIAADQIWLRAIEDARDYHRECAAALNRMIEEHFASRSGK